MDSIRTSLVTGGPFWTRGPREKPIPERVLRADRRAALWVASEQLLSAQPLHR